MSSISFDLQQFRIACSKFPTGVTVTTVLGSDGPPYGVTASSFTSVSLTPPLVLVCIDHRSQIRRHLEIGRPFGINVLSEDQQELSIQFSRNWSERFMKVHWHAGTTGVPLLHDALATFECTIVNLIAAGDHVIVLGEVLCVTASERSPLTYVNSSYGKIEVAG